MAKVSYEKAKKLVFRGMGILAAVTVAEVIVSLFGKGYIISGIENHPVVFFISGLVIISLSLYKAHYIIYEFMHMKYEAKGLAMSVLLPTLLLIWAIIAFFHEGSSWGDRRAQIQDWDAEPPAMMDSKAKETGSIPDDTKVIDTVN